MATRVCAWPPCWVPCSQQVSLPPSLFPLAFQDEKLKQTRTTGASWLPALGGEAVWDGGGTWKGGKQGIAGHPLLPKMEETVSSSGGREEWSRD